MGSILVVEDDADTRDTLRDVLTNEGFDVRVEASAEEAVDVVTAFERPSLILLDSRLSGMTGVEFLDWIQTRRELDDIAVVLVSGDSSSQPHQRAVALLRKPYDLETLLHLANRYCKVEPG